jgi:DNA-binding SARP family transcriptional activator
LAQDGAPVAKDILMDLFWSDVEPEAARRNLHQAVYSLRQTLRRRDPDNQYILFENNQYSLNSELSVWLDVEEFEAAVQNGRRLESTGQQAEAMRHYAAAVHLYQGDFLADDLYEDWPRPRRQQLRLDVLEVANRLSEYKHEQAEHTAAIALCQQILALDNCYEEAHRRLMRLYLAQGQRHLAIRQYHHCTQALAEELDVPPSAETRALYEQITAHT